MSSSRYSESIIYTEGESSEIEKNRKLMENINKRIDKIEKDFVRRVGYNRDEMDLIRQRIDNAHQMQSTLFDSLREIRKDIEIFKGTKSSEGTRGTGKQGVSPVPELTTSPILPAADRLYHVSNIFNLTNN